MAPSRARETGRTDGRSHACRSGAEMEGTGAVLKITATRTVCLLAERWLNEASGRSAGQAIQLFEDRLLKLSKALAPFVKTDGF